MSGVDMSELAADVATIKQTLLSKEQLEAQRRQTDDERYTRLSAGQHEILQRTDKHGLRTTAIETQWQAFFGEQGAFRLVMKSIEEYGKKQEAREEKNDKRFERINWILGLGIGGLAVIQFLAPYIVHAK